MALPGYFGVDGTKRTAVGAMLPYVQTDSLDSQSRAALACSRRVGLNYIPIRPSSAVVVVGRWLGSVGVPKRVFELIDRAMETNNGRLKAGEGIAPVLGPKRSKAHVEVVHGLVKFGDGTTHGTVMEQGGVAGRFGSGVTAGQNGSRNRGKGELTAIHAASSQGGGEVCKPTHLPQANYPRARTMAPAAISSPPASLRVVSASPSSGQASRMTNTTLSLSIGATLEA